MDDELAFLRGLKRKVLFSQEPAAASELIRIVMKINEADRPKAPAKSFHIQIGTSQIFVGRDANEDIEPVIKSCLTPGVDVEKQKRNMVVSVLSSRDVKIIHKLNSGVTAYRAKRGTTLWVTLLVTD